jgi:hypothetical protein
LGRGKKSKMSKAIVPVSSNIKLGNAKANLQKMTWSTDQQISVPTKNARNFKINMGKKTTSVADKPTNKNVQKFIIMMSKQIKNLVNKGKSKESAFRQLSKEYHPNKGGSKEQFQVLQMLKNNKKLNSEIKALPAPKPDIVSSTLGKAMTPGKQFTGFNNKKIKDMLNKKIPKQNGPLKRIKNTIKRNPVTTAAGAAVATGAAGAAGASKKNNINKSSFTYGDIRSISTEMLKYARKTKNSAKTQKDLDTLKKRLETHIKQIRARKKLMNGNPMVNEVWAAIVANKGKPNYMKTIEQGVKK